MAKNMTDSLSDAEVKDVILQTLRESGRDNIEAVIDYLENKSDFFTAPASTRFHGAAPGFLARHSLNVYYRMLSLCTEERDIYGRWASEEEFVSACKSCAIIGLLHDVCKTGFYKPGTRNVKDETGKWQSVPCYTIDDSLPYGHGEKSVYIISSFIRLTREEAMAIRWHMGGFDNAVRGGDYGLSGAYSKFPLAVIAHVADLQASYLDEAEGK